MSTSPAIQSSRASQTAEAEPPRAIRVLIVDDEEDQFVLVRRLPAVAIFTTATDPELVRRAYGTGANASVGKPSSINGMRETMAGIVRHWFEIATLPERR